MISPVNSGSELWPGGKACIAGGMGVSVMAKLLACVGDNTGGDPRFHIFNPVADATSHSNELRSATNASKPFNRAGAKLRKCC